MHPQHPYYSMTRGPGGPPPYGGAATPEWRKLADPTAAALDVRRKLVRMTAGHFDSVPIQLTEAFKDTPSPDIDPLLNAALKFSHEAFVGAYGCLQQSLKRSLPPCWAEVSPDSPPTVDSLLGPRGKGVLQDVSHEFLLATLPQLVSMISLRHADSPKGRVWENAQIRTEMWQGRVIGVPVQAHSIFEVPGLGRALFGDLWTPHCDELAIAHEVVEVGTLYRPDTVRDSMPVIQNLKRQSELLDRFVAAYRERGLYLLFGIRTHTESPRAEADARRALGEFAMPLVPWIKGLSELLADPPRGDPPRGDPPRGKPPRGEPPRLWWGSVLGSELIHGAHAIRKERILSSLIEKFPSRTNENRDTSHKTPDYHLNCPRDDIIQIARASVLLSIVDRYCQADSMRFLAEDYQKHNFNMSSDETFARDLRIRVVLEATRLDAAFDSVLRSITALQSADFFSAEEAQKVATVAEYGKGVFRARIKEHYNPLLENLGASPITEEELTEARDRFVDPMRRMTEELRNDQIQKEVERALGALFDEREWARVLRAPNSAF